MSSSSNPTTSILITFAIIILVVVSRTIRNIRGVRVSAGRTIGYTIFYFVFGGFFVATSFFEGVPLYYAIPDVAILALAAIWSYRFADRRVAFWKAEDGSIFYKGGIIIYLIYIVGLIARLSVDFLVIGPSGFTFSFNGTLSQNAIIGSIVTDLLLMFGIGLLIGRNLRVFKRYNRIIQGKESVASIPQNYEPL